jgi:FAD/FMN-containing dehydrogenase
MRRRDVLKAAATTAFLARLVSLGIAPAAMRATSAIRSRARPGEPGWPSAATWDTLNQEVSGRLFRPESPFADESGSVRTEALKSVKNPYYLGDQAGLTQTSGWVDAWISQPSAYAVAANNTSDVVAAVNFAREHHLRLVVKGGGHSYQGTSNARDSLLVWTRHMNDITVKEAFIAQGCEGKRAAQPAVTVGAGAMWMDAYDAVTTRSSRYVQGGGCATVGIAGLVQSGGFGSFSKRYGTAAGGLLEAEIVTADGKARIANECMHPDLFWAIKGGGGGTFGVITRLTLRTHELPEYFGAMLGRIKASSDDAFRALIAKAVSFYHEDLFNPHWGESLIFRGDNVLDLEMLFQGLNQQQAEQLWTPFFDWIRSQPEYSFTRKPTPLSVPAQRFWDAEYMRQHVPGVMIADDRAGSPAHHVFWQANEDEAGQLLYAYKSAWLPASLLQPMRQSDFVDALFAATRHWTVALHFNKGLAAAPADAIVAARNSATNPQVLDAFALAIIACEGPPAYPGMPGPAPDLVRARDNAQRVSRAMDALLRVAPGAGAYVSESDYFQDDWQNAFWGTNRTKLAAVKRKYDPAGLFFVHHGVGSEAWSTDGFTRLRI